MKVILLSLLLAAAAWPQAAPKFEVASVKPHELTASPFAIPRAGAASSIRQAGNRITLSGTLAVLVMAAYNLKDYQVSSVPDWTHREGRTEVYDIVAKTEGDATPTMDQVRMALQALLVERFQLKVHHSTAEVAVYSLTVDKNGLKLKESAPGAVRNVDMLEASGALFRVKFTNCTMTDFARMITSNFDRPVNDDTGLKPGYDFTLEYAPRRPDGSLVPGQEASTAIEAAPTIVPALQRELGLKVAPAKEQLETVVIDHAEKPTAN